NTGYSYDAAGNLATVTYPVSHGIAMAYDVLNRLTNMVDGVGAAAYSFTTGGLLQSEDGPWPSDTVSYSYQNRLRTGLNLRRPTPQIGFRAIPTTPPRGSIP